MNNGCWYNIYIDFIYVVCKIFYEETHNTWKAHVVIAKADKEEVL